MVMVAKTTILGNGLVPRELSSLNPPIAYQLFFRMTGKKMPPVRAVPCTLRVMTWLFQRIHAVLMEVHG